MNLGFDGDLALVAGIAGGITKMALFPLAQLRRRVDADKNGQADDVATGAYYVHPDLQAPVVLVLLCLGGFAFAAATGQALFPVLSAVVTGFAGARATHESISAARA